MTGDLVNVRAGPSTGYPGIGQGRVGERALELGREDGWVRLRLEDGLEGWMFGQYVARTPPMVVERREPRPAVPQVADDEIISAIISASIASYYGSCPCRYNVDRAGRRCGGRSAYSRAGGASPLCYSQDMPASMVAAYRSNLATR